MANKRRKKKQEEEVNKSNISLDFSVIFDIQQVF
jgi:hypothetical protein